MTTHNCCQTRRRASLLDAASALASLGGTPPPVQYRIQETDPIEIHEMPLDDTSQSLKLPTSLRCDVPMPFPDRLMEVLSNDDISSIITWLPQGRGFVVLQKRKFAQLIMPAYFKQSKYTSFTRKLNRWGFARATTGSDVGVYYHKYFQRDDPILCMRMYCKSYKALSKTDSSEKSSTVPPKAKPPQLPSAPSKSNQADKELCPKSSQIVHTGQSVLGFDRVLHRQRQLLRQSQQASAPPLSIGSSLRLGRVFGRQQQLLRSANNDRANHMSQPCHTEDFRYQQPYYNVNQSSQVRAYLVAAHPPADTTINS